MKEKSFFFKKNVSEPSNPPAELAQNVSKKNPFRTNYSSIFSEKVQNLTVFSIIYMIRIRFFGPGELIQNYFRRAQYTNIFLKSSPRKSRFSCALQAAQTPSLHCQIHGARGNAAQRPPGLTYEHVSTAEPSPSRLDTPTDS